MATLREIRTRLRSVENIKQITKAMEMVAAARLKRAQARAEQSRPYISKMKSILESLASSSSDGKHPFMQSRIIKKTGLFVVTADRGLCGSYNTNILSAADKFLKNHTRDSVDLILMGRKAIDHYRQGPWKIRHKVFEDGEKQDVSQVRAFAHQLGNWFIDGELDDIWIIYTHFINIMSRKVIIEKFLNIREPAKNKPALNYIYEPSTEAVFDEILPRFLVGKLHTAFDEAYASELAARIVSMRTATKNAEEMIYNLTLTRNKVRQAGITKEMLEIINGAEGLK